MSSLSCSGAHPKNVQDQAGGEEDILGTAGVVELVIVRSRMPTGIVAETGHGR